MNVDADFPMNIFRTTDLNKIDKGLFGVIIVSVETNRSVWIYVKFLKFTNEICKSHGFLSFGFVWFRQFRLYQISGGSSRKKFSKLSIESFSILHARDGLTNPPPLPTRRIGYLKKKKKKSSRSSQLAYVRLNNFSRLSVPRCHGSKV